MTSNQAFHSLQTPLVAPVAPQMLSKSSLAHGGGSLLEEGEGLRATALVQDGTHLPQAGFGAVLPRHVPEHDRRRHQTTTHSVFGGKYADSPDKRIDTSSSAGATQALQSPQSKAAGKVLTNAGRATGIRTGGSTDERLQLGDSDPKCHTFVQRTWLGHDSHQDYVLRAADYSATIAQRNAGEGNVPGAALAGLDAQDTLGRTSATAGAPTAQGGIDRRFFKKNDTIKRDVGIWNE